MCVHVSPFPFGGILFQVNQPLVFGKRIFKLGPNGRILSPFWERYLAKMVDPLQRGAVPHLVMENRVFNRNIRKVSYTQVLDWFHLSNYSLYILCYSCIMLLGGP